MAHSHPLSPVYRAPAPRTLRRPVRGVCPLLSIREHRPPGRTRLRPPVPLHGQPLPAGDLAEFLDAVLGAGVDIVQLREKGLEARDECVTLRCSPPPPSGTEAVRGHDRADIAWPPEPRCCIWGRTICP